MKELTKNHGVTGYSIIWSFSIKEPQRTGSLISENHDYEIKEPPWEPEGV